MKGCEDGSFWWNLTFFFILVQMIRLNLCNTWYLRLLEELSYTLNRGSACPRQRGILRLKWNMNLTLPKPPAWRTQSNCKWGSCKPDALFIYSAQTLTGCECWVHAGESQQQPDEISGQWVKSLLSEVMAPRIEKTSSWGKSLIIGETVLCVSTTFNKYTRIKCFKKDFNDYNENIGET